MAGGKFSIIKVVGDSYAGVWAERRYLARLAPLPVVVTAGFSLFALVMRPEAGDIEATLWRLPGTMLTAWFCAQAARLFLRGDRRVFGWRRREIAAAVLIATLVNMGTTAVTAVIMAIAPAPGSGGDRLALAAIAVLGGAMLWALRVMLAPPLVAAGMRVRPVLVRTRGVLFSLRLAAVLLLCALPLTLVFQVLVGLAGAHAGVFAVLIAAPLSLCVSAATTGALCGIIREV